MPSESDNLSRRARTTGYGWITANIVSVRSDAVELEGKRNTIA